MSSQQRDPHGVLKCEETELHSIDFDDGSAIQDDIIADADSEYRNLKHVETDSESSLWLMNAPAKRAEQRHTVHFGGRAWDRFYRHVGSRFFRDRHYIAREYPEILPPHCVVHGGSGPWLPEPQEICLDAGCGVGNALLPLFIHCRGSLAFVGFDVSVTAVSILRTAAGSIISSPELHSPPPQPYTPPIAAFAVRGEEELRGKWPVDSAIRNAVLTLSDDRCGLPEHTRRHMLSLLQVDGSTPLHNQGFHSALLYFVLSALPFDAHIPFLQQLAFALKEGGRLIFRDYADGDAAQARFADASAVLADRLCVRGDGTLAAFFTSADIRYYAAMCGLHVQQLQFVRKTICNRATGERFERVFLQAVLVKPRADLLRFQAEQRRWSSASTQPRSTIIQR